MLTGAVVAAAGARDYYELAIALHDDDLLERLVTDLYIPLDQPFLGALTSAIGLQELFSRRFSASLPSRKVLTPSYALWFNVASKLLPNRDTFYRKDKLLGTCAARLAESKEAALFLYSYYAHAAFSRCTAVLPYRFLFQVHPHPIEVRRILSEEFQLNPLAQDSLLQELDLFLPQVQFDELAAEPHLANGWVVASNFTASTLVHQGIAREAIHVVPYGVDVSAFPERTKPPDEEHPFTIVFVGRMIQRKGLSYLLDAVRMLKTGQVRVVLMGRGFRDDRLLSQYSDVPHEVHTNLPRPELVRKIYEADVMVLPSLVEGFAHVILEAMSCGVPVITTPNTCGPDVIDDGVHGFIVPIREPNAIAEKLTWAMENRVELAEMGKAAAAQARRYTWQRFRTGIQAAYRSMLIKVDARKVDV